MSISQKTLKRLLDYDPNSGAFTRKVRTANRVQIGDAAGCTNKNGYVQIQVGGKLHLAHRLAFIFMTGSCPQEVDHKNGIRDDNRWANLRPATTSQNQMNRRSLKGSSSRYLGVSWHKLRGKWHANIHVDGKKKHLGSFSDEDDAARAYDTAARKHFGEYANLNFGE